MRTTVVIHGSVAYAAGGCCRVAAQRCALRKISMSQNGFLKVFAAIATASAIVHPSVRRNGSSVVGFVSKAHCMTKMHVDSPNILGRDGEHHLMLREPTAFR